MHSSKETLIKGNRCFDNAGNLGSSSKQTFFFADSQDRFREEDSSNVTGRQIDQRSSKRKLPLLVVSLMVILVILIFTDLALYPCTFIRNDIHEVLTEKKDLVILGSSNGKMDLDPDILLKGTGKTGHNLCVGGEYPVDAYYLTRLMVEKNTPQQILFELDPGYFMTEKEPGNNYLLFFHEFPLSMAKLSYFADALRYCDLRTVFFPAYEYSLSYEIPRVKETLKRKLSKDYSIEPFKGKVQEYHENGWIEKYPVEEDNFPVYEGFSFEINEKVEKNTAYLKKLSDFCERKGLKFQIAVMPVPEKALEQDRADYDKAWQYFEEFCTTHQIPLYNFNTDYYDLFSHDEVNFVDYDGHMKGESAASFSAVFGQLLKRGGI